MDNKASQKHSIIADASLYTLMQILTQLLTLVAGILTRKFLGPVQMGVWSLFQIVLIYANYTPLGVTEAITREIPYQLGKGDEAQANRVKDVICTFALFTAFLSAAAVIIYAVVFQSRLPEEVFMGLFFIAALIILQRINALVIAYLRGYKKFTLAGKQILYSALFSSILVAVLSYKFKIFGFMWAMCLSMIFNIVYVERHRVFRFHWIWDWKLTKELMGMGLPLIGIALMNSFFLSIDKIMIAKYLDLRSLGIYSVAILAYTYLTTFPNSIGIILVPNFHEKFGKSRNAGDLKGYLTKSSLVFSDLMPLLIGYVWFLVPYFAHLVLPDFVESIPPMRTLILGSYFLALWHPYSYFLTVVRKQVLLIPIILIACALAMASNYWVLKSGLGLTGIGIANTAVTFVKFTATYFIGASYLTSFKEELRFYGWVVSKFLFMLAALLGLSFFLKNETVQLAPAVLQCVILTLLYLPFLIHLNKKINVTDALKHRFFNKKNIPAS